MADQLEQAGDYEQRERELALANHRVVMASIKPADDCRSCGEELLPHRVQWGVCIDCATRAESASKGFRA